MQAPVRQAQWDSTPHTAFDVATADAVGAGGREVSRLLASLRRVTDGLGDEAEGGRHVTDGASAPPVRIRR